MLIWRYEPGWTGNTISARICHYGSFAFVFISYKMCHILTKYVMNLYNIPAAPAYGMYECDIPDMVSIRISLTEHCC